MFLGWSEQFSCLCFQFRNRSINLHLSNTSIEGIVANQCTKDGCEHVGNVYLNQNFKPKMEIKTLQSLFESYSTNNSTQFVQSDRIANDLILLFEWILHLKLCLVMVSCRHKSFKLPREVSYIDEIKFVELLHTILSK